MYTPIGKVQERSPYRLPDAPVSRIHPVDSSFVHRTGKAVKDNDGRTIGHKGECVKKLRHTVMSGRSKMTVASASSKAQIFVKTNGQIDHAIDFPVQAFTPAPYKRGICVDTRRRMAR